MWNDANKSAWHRKPKWNDTKREDCCHCLKAFLFLSMWFIFVLVFLSADRMWMLLNVGGWGGGVWSFIEIQAKFHLPPFPVVVEECHWGFGYPLKDKGIRHARPCINSTKWDRFHSLCWITGFSFHVQTKCPSFCARFIIIAKIFHSFQRLVYLFT